MSNKSWLEIRENPDAEEWIEGAKTLINVILQADVHPDIKRISLNYLIWPVGEARFILDGGKNYKPVKKGKLRKEEMAAKYCSFEAGELLKKEMGKGCRRDHVFGRKEIIDWLLKNERRVIKDIEKFAVVCLVTKDEHNALTKVKNKNGWEKYAETKLGFKILDRKSRKQTSLKKLSHVRLPR
jgi:hypothetical protein